MLVPTIVQEVRSSQSVWREWSAEGWLLAERANITG